MPNEELDNNGLSSDFDYDKFLKDVEDYSADDLSVAKSTSDTGIAFEDTKGMTQFDSPELYRAQQQSGAAQGFNAVAGGITKGLLTAVEDISYIADFESHINALRGVDDWERNAVADWAIDMKKEVDEALPIYRTSTDTFDFSDPGFYWSSLSGIIDSAVGFGLPGGAVAKGVGALTKASKVAKLASYLAKSDKAADVVNMVGSAGVNTWAEGTMMGHEAFESTKESLEKAREVDGLKISDEEINTLAGEAANEMRTSNMAMMATNAFAMHGLAKGKGTFGSILKERNLKNRFKEFGKTLYQPNSDNLILQGLGEAGEEMIQGGFQQEAQYQAEKKAGIDKDGVPDNYLERMLEFSTSDEALLEGMMGFFGGGPQRILSEVTSGRHTKSAKEEYKRRYDAQQQMMSANAEYFEDSSKLYKEAAEKSAALRELGEDKLADATDRSVMGHRVLANLEAGTIEQFDKDLQTIIQEGGVKDANGNIKEDSKKAAEETLALSEELKKEWVRNSSKVNVGSIVRNRTNNKLLESYEAVLQEKKAKSDAELQGAINAMYPVQSRKPIKGKGKITEATELNYSVEGILNNPINSKLNWDASLAQDKMIDKVKKTPQYKENELINNQLTSLQKELKNNQDAYTKLKSDAGQKEYVAKLTELTKQREADTKVRQETVETVDHEDISTPDATLTPGKTYVSKDGGNYTFEGYSGAGNLLIKKVGAKAADSMPLAEFTAKFMPEGMLKVRQNEEEVVNTAKEEGAKASKSDDAIVEFKNSIDDVEPSNDTKENLQETVKYHKSNDIYSLAWMSANHPNQRKDDKSIKDITDFLENRNNNLEGITVEFIAGTEDNLLDPKVFEKAVAGGAIKANLIGSDGKIINHNGTDISLHLHLPGYLYTAKGVEDSDALDYYNKLEAFRKDILIRVAKGEKVFSTIESKGNGNIQSDKENKNLKATMQEDKSSKITLMARYSDGELYTAFNQPVEDVEGSFKPDAPKGTIFASVPMANGKNFPLRLNVRNITDSEANLISNLYLALATGSVGYGDNIDSDNATLIKGLIVANDELNDIVKSMIASNKEYSSTSDITIGELISEVVYEGEQDAKNIKFPLHMSKGIVTFGENKISAKDLAVNNKPLTDWLTANKIRNVKMNKLNNTSYKNYILDNNVVQTNAVGDENGVKFIQPTIKISGELNSGGQATSIPEAMVTPTQTKEVIVDEESGQRATVQPQSVIDQLRAQQEAEKATNEMSKDVDAFTAFENEMLNKYTKEAVDKAGSFKEFYDVSTMLLGVENEETLAKAKQDYENQIKTCL